MHGILSWGQQTLPAQPLGVKVVVVQRDQETRGGSVFVQAVRGDRDAFYSLLEKLDPFAVRGYCVRRAEAGGHSMEFRGASEAQINEAKIHFHAGQILEPVMAAMDSMGKAFDLEQLEFLECLPEQGAAIVDLTQRSLVILSELRQVLVDISTSNGPAL